MERQRARAIFTNDAECDDMNSFLHLLLYANDVDIEGLVLSSSIFHYAGDPERGIEPKRWAGGDWMWEYLDAYERVWKNLVVHDPSYPSPDALRAVTCIGNVKRTGEMDADSEGSELVRKAILREDERPVWLLAGGGTNTIGRALRHIEEEWRDTPHWDEVYARVCRQTRIYMIVTQDDSYRDYISTVWPDIPLLHCTNIMGIAFVFNEAFDPADALHVFSGDWVKPQLLDQGPLLSHYHTWFDGHVYPGEQDRSQFGSNLSMEGGNWWGKEVTHRYDMISEGDSPSFLHLIDKGLRSLEDPSFGGWGGRFERNDRNEFNPRADYWQSATDEDQGPTKGDSLQLTRWVHDWMNDFASRAHWCVAERYEDANHAPEVSLRQGLDLAVRPGELLRLDAEATDPDGDALDFEWFDYPEAGSCPSRPKVEAEGHSAQVTVPTDAKPGQTLHVIVRVRDDADGSRPTYMVSYARAVLTVA